MKLIDSRNTASTGKVSVCLLVYNDPGCIEATVRSILAQTISDVEFIISDDCSTDGAWEEVLNLAKMYANIRPIRTPHNLKMCGNANFAVSHSSGDYIALLHHGDIYREDLLESWLKVMKRYESVGFVFNDFIVTSKTGLVQEHEYRGQQFSEWMAGPEFLEKELLSRWGCCVWGTAMIRRSCWEIVGGMREEFDLVADVDLWMRLAARWDVGYVNAPLFTVRAAKHRPENYPAEYRDFSWKRWKLSYAIHAANLVEHYKDSGLCYWWKWLHFRIRVSLETCKWLTYALVRRRAQMILESPLAQCDWELLPVHWYRNCLVWGNRWGIL